MIDKIQRVIKKKDLFILLCFGILSEFLYLAFFLVNPLKSLVNGDGALMASNEMYLGIIVVLFALALLYIKVFKRIDFKKVEFKYIVSFAILFNLTLLFILPLSSNDLYTYVYRSRIASKYHQNPYLVAYDNFPDDEFYSQISNRWSGNTTVYGPFFLAIGIILSDVGGDNLLLNIFLIKILFVALNISNVYLIKKISGSNAAAFLYSWNPLVNYELALNAHNDVLLIFFMLLSLLFLFKKKSLKMYVISSFFFTLSILVKFFTLILIPFYIAYISHRLSNNKARVKFLMLAGIVGLLVTFILYYPFWDGFIIFSRIFDLAGLRNIANSSLGILIISIIFFILGVNSFYEWSVIVSRWIFTAIYFYLLAKAVLIKKIDSKASLLFYFNVAFGLFLAIFLNWWLSWYQTTLIALLSIYIGLTEKHNLYKLVFGITVYSIMLSLFTR